MDYNVDSNDSFDAVLRVLYESSIPHEDAVNELWRDQRSTMWPRRWALVGNKSFVVIPPNMPSSYTGIVPDVRVHYEKMAVLPNINSDGVLWIDPDIPDYYQDAIRYIASAYLMEKDTDLKSIQLRDEYMKSFEYHMSGNVPKLGIIEQDA